MRDTQTIGLRSTDRRSVLRNASRRIFHPLIGSLGIWVLGCFSIASAAEQPDSPPLDEVAQKASVDGKYRHLLHKVHAPGDKAQYSGQELHDYGWWTGESYGDGTNLQHGYWVWIEPHWYIFSECGEHPLHFAAQHGHLAAVERILQRDKSLVLSKDEHNRTPLEVAVYSHQLGVASVLVEHGDAKNFSIADGNSTFLHWTAEHGFHKAAQKLVDAGADLSRKDADGRTPLQAAVFNNQLAVADVLVSEATVEDLPVPEGASPLHWAIENGMIRTVAELIAAGNDVNEADDDGQSPLHVAAYEGNAPITKLLIEHKADVNARGPSGQTPLHAAAEVGDTAVAALLLVAGAEASPADNSSYTPLHAAAWNNHPETAMLLLHLKAQVDARTDDAETPLHKAAWRGHEKVALILLTHGADRNAKDNFDLTPLDKANSDIERMTPKQAVAKWLAGERRYFCDGVSLRHGGSTTASSLSGNLRELQKRWPRLLPITGYFCAQLLPAG